MWKLTLYSDSISEYSWNLLYIPERFAIVVEFDEISFVDATIRLKIEAFFYFTVKFV